MLKLFSLCCRRSCAQVVVFAAVLAPALSNAFSQTTLLRRQLDRVDIGVGGVGILTKNVSGSDYQNVPVALNPSTTAGALVQVRYTKSPLIGLEFNYTYGRFTQDFIGPRFATGAGANGVFGVQNDMSEYSIGYVAHLPTFLGVQPFAVVGAGATAFKPTPLGGQSLPERARASYFYELGVDDEVTKHFGFRAQFRQSFYKAPDFGQNYLTINQQTFTTEPSIGFYLKF